jgi:hypothetical protein
VHNITNPPRYRGAEDMSGQARAFRRGALTQTEFLERMQRSRFKLVETSSSPSFEFTHDVLGEQVLSVRPLENFSTAYDRLVGMVGEMTIVKLQKPMSGPLDDAWLAYPKGKPWTLLIARSSVPEPIRRVVDETFKGFFYARRIGSSHALIFGGQAPDQRW